MAHSSSSSSASGAVESDDEETRWLCRVREALEHATAESLGAFPKVFDVPRALRDSKPDAYAPQHFALGPYHHRARRELRDMERYKLAAAKRAERHFAGGRRIPDLVRRLHALQGELRGPYHRILELRNETLAWMMAVDTSFLLDFLLARYGDDAAPAPAVVSAAANWINATLRDVVMLENQLPLVLLRRNLELRYDGGDELAAAAGVLAGVLDRFARDVCPVKTKADAVLPDVAGQAHLLELLYHFLVPSAAVFDDDDGHPPPPASDEHAGADDDDDVEKQQQQVPAAAELDKVKRVCLQVSSMRFVKENLIARPKNLSGELVKKLPPALAGLLPAVGKMMASVDVQATLLNGGVNMGTTGTNAAPPLAQEIKIPSVEQLAGSGVRFAPAPEGIAGIAFDARTATLHLPVVVLDGNTEVVLRNLVAFEAVAVRGPLVLARYTELMNGVVDTARDVRILERSGVVVNRMKSKAEAAALWNGMCRAARVGRVPRLDAVIRAVNAHRDRRAAARARRMLAKYVFRSWKMLTLLASVALLLMTALQTFCATYPCQTTWFGHILPPS